MAPQGTIETGALESSEKLSVHNIRLALLGSCSQRLIGQRSLEGKYLGTTDLNQALLSLALCYMKYFSRILKFTIRARAHFPC